jgi:hydroxyethylthiazole kinase
MIGKHPLILNITNSVTIDFVANALLAVGAAPVMSEDPQDAKELASLSQGINLNIGTLNDHQLRIIDFLLKEESRKIFSLDPVGVGATTVRTSAAIKILESDKIRLIRGNASEIASLAGNIGETRGVDSTKSSLNVKDSARFLSEKYNCFVVVSGEVDLLTDGKVLFRVYNGSPMMPRITGTGCVLSAFLTAVLADGKDSLEDLANACAYFGYMGEVAEKLVQGVGSFKVRFLDALHNIKYSDVHSNLKIEQSNK